MSRSDYGEEKSKRNLYLIIGGFAALVLVLGIAVAFYMGAGAVTTINDSLKTKIQEKIKDINEKATDKLYKAIYKATELGLFYLVFRPTDKDLKLVVPKKSTDTYKADFITALQKVINNKKIEDKTIEEPLTKENEFEVALDKEKVKNFKLELKKKMFYSLGCWIKSSVYDETLSLVKHFQESMNETGSKKNSYIIVLVEDKKVKIYNVFGEKRPEITSSLKESKFSISETTVPLKAIMQYVLVEFSQVVTANDPNKINAKGDKVDTNQSTAATTPAATPAPAPNPTANTNSTSLNTSAAATTTTDPATPPKS